MADKKFYESSEFKRLKREWEAKLKQSGFRDIEYQINGEPADFMVGPNPMDILKRHTPEKERFYELARQLYWTLIEEKVPKRYSAIWGKYADGKSIQSIVDEGIGRGNARPTRWEVSTVVKQCKERLLRECRHGRAVDEDQD